MHLVGFTIEMEPNNLYNPLAYLSIANVKCGLWANGKFPITTVAICTALCNFQAETPYQVPEHLTCTLLEGAYTER